MFGMTPRKIESSRIVVLPLVLFIIGAMVVFAPVTHATHRPGPNTPQVLPCQLTVWETIYTDHFGHTAGSQSYTLTDNLQETYDTGFSTWCQHYRTQVLLTANSGNQGGTIIAKVAPCGSNLNSNTKSYSFPAGSFSNREYDSPTIYVSSGAAQDGDELKAAGQDWPDKGSCAGN